MIDGKYKSLLFKNDDDVWDIISKLIEETKGVNKSMGKSFDIGNSILHQIHFFACKNIFLSSEVQQDVAKHLYCSEYGVPAYKGTYGEQPAKWVHKSFIIRSALTKRENMLQQKHMDKVKNENK